MKNNKKLNITNELEKTMVGLKKPEFWIGVISFIFILGILTYTLKPFASKMITKILLNKSERFVSPIPENTKPVVIITPTQSPLSKINKFSDTGIVSVIVNNGDTFWSISKKICGTGIFYEKIQESNGYTNISLQPGDKINVLCE